MKIVQSLKKFTISVEITFKKLENLMKYRNYCFIGQEILKNNVKNVEIWVKLFKMYEKIEESRFFVILIKFGPFRCHLNHSYNILNKFRSKFNNFFDVLCNFEYNFKEFYSNSNNFSIKVLILFSQIQMLILYIFFWWNFITFDNTFADFSTLFEKLTSNFNEYSKIQRKLPYFEQF